MGFSLRLRSQRNIDAFVVRTDGLTAKARCTFGFGTLDLNRKYSVVPSARSLPDDIRMVHIGVTLCQMEKLSFRNVKYPQISG